MSTCKAALFVVALYAASPNAWSQSLECRPETIEYYIGRLHRTPPMTGCKVDAITAYVGKLGYRTQIRDQSSPHPAGEIIFQYPLADQPLPSNRTFTLTVPDRSPQAPTTTPASSTPSVIQIPKSSSPKVAAAVDVRVSNALSGKPPFRSGEEVAFRIVVENDGPVPASRVNLYLESRDLTLIGVSGACSRAGCFLGGLQQGDRKVIDVDGVISAAGNFSLLATIRHAEPDPDIQNNASVAGNRAQPAPPPSSQSPQFAVDNKLYSKGPYHAGDNAEFLLRVHNVGAGPANEVAVNDRFSNLRLLRVEGDCKQLPCSVGNIQAGAGIKLLVRAGIIGQGPFTLTVTATPANGMPENASAGSEALLQPVAALSLGNALSSGEPLQAGDKAEFTVKVQNNGRAAANDVQVVDDFSNLELVSVKGNCTQLPCRLASLSPGATGDLVVRATILAPGQFRSTVTVTSAQAHPISASASGSAGAAQLRTLWSWIKGNVEAAVGGSLALVIFAFGGATLARWLWWRTRIQARAELDRAGSTHIPAPMPILAPSVSVYVHLEPGSAGPSGSIPILNEEVRRD